MKTKILLSAVTCAFIIAVMFHITAQKSTDAPLALQPKEAVTVLTSPPTPVLTVKKLDTALQGQKPVMEAYPEITHDPEAVLAIQLDRLQKVFPNLEKIPEDWTKFNPQELVIAPYADVKIPAQLTSTQTIKGRVVNTYTNGFQGGYIVTAATEKEMVTIVTVPAADIFTVTIKNNEVAVTTAPIADCGTDAINHNHPADAQNIPKETNFRTHAAQETQTDATYISKVGFFYTQDTLVDFGNSATLLETQYIAQIVTANIVLDNSNIPLQWQYIGAFQTPSFELLPYEVLGTKSPTGVALSGTDSSSYHYNALEILSDDSNHIGAGNQSAHDWAQAKILEIGADQSVFIVPVAPDRSGIAGLAYLGGPPNYMARETAVRTNSDYITLAHELGHNFGCRHDRATDNIPDSNTNYNYGYTQTHAILLTVETEQWHVERLIGTVMSYTSYYIPFFSSPLITFPGNTPLPTDGTPATNKEAFIIGISEGQIGAADNARYMREALQNMPIPRTAPVILEQPQSMTVAINTSFTLTVSAFGQEMRYRWYKNNNPLNAYEHAYTETPTATTQSGTYTVKVSNKWGEVTSDPAIVTVTSEPTIAPPTINSHPQGVTITQGASFTLTVVASGTDLNYQWKKAGSNISGATSASYTKTSATTGDAGNYTVTVSNTAGSVTSNPANVVVNTPVTAPTITRQPTSVTINQGASFTLSVSAAGSNLSYQWKKAGANISGATSASYTKSSATTGDAGSYTVTITNSAGSITSNPVTVTVNATPSGGNNAGSNSGGGGGGGGAPSLLLITGLGVIGLLKRLKK